MLYHTFALQRLRGMRNRLKQKKNQLQEIQDAIDAVATEESDVPIDELKTEMTYIASLFSFYFKLYD